MAHARQTIREAAATLLTGLTTTGSRVFQSRMPPQDSLPCLLIKTPNEKALPLTIGNIQERNLRLTITGCAKPSANVDDLLDTIAAEVETAMAGFAYTNQYDETDSDFDEGLEKPSGLIEITFIVTYFTAAGTPGTPI